MHALRKDPKATAFRGMGPDCEVVLRSRRNVSAAPRHRQGFVTPTSVVMDVIDLAVATALLLAAGG